MGGSNCCHSIFNISNRQFWWIRICQIWILFSRLTLNWRLAWPRICLRLNRSIALSFVSWFCIIDKISSRRIYRWWINIKFSCWHRFPYIIITSSIGNYLWIDPNVWLNAIWWPVFIILNEFLRLLRWVYLFHFLAWRWYIFEKFHTKSVLYFRLIINYLWNWIIQAWVQRNTIVLLTTMLFLRLHSFRGWMLRNFKLLIGQQWV